MILGFRCLLVFSLFFNHLVYGQSNVNKYSDIDTILSATKAILEIEKVLASQKLTRNDSIALNYRVCQKLFLLAKYDSLLIRIDKLILSVHSVKNHEIIASAYLLKGKALYYLYHMAEAENSYRLAIGYARKLNLNKVLYSAQSSLGCVLIELKKIDSAEYYLTQALKLEKELDSLSSDQGLVTQRLLATLYIIKGDKEQAFKIYDNVYNQYKIRVSNKGPYIVFLLFYAQAQIQNNNQDRANLLLNEAQQLEKENPNIKTRISIKRIKTQLYASKEKYKEAYYTLDSVLQEFEIDYSEESKELLAETEAKFNNQLLTKDLIIERDRKTKVGLWAILLLVIIIFSWVSFYLYQKRKRALQKAKESKISLNAFIDGEEKERTRISRELHDGIAQDLLALKFSLQKSNIDQAQICELDKIVSDIRNLSYQLMPLTLKVLGLKAAIEETCYKMREHHNILIEWLIEDFDEKFPLEIETSLYRIFQELIQNIIKHSHATEVYVQLFHKNNHIQLIVEDNGKGFDISTQKQGLGLNNLVSRVRMINGQINYESEEGDGTVAIVRIPYQKNQ